MPITDPDLTTLSICLGAKDRKRLDRIIRAISRATRGVGTSSAAVRWALRELDGRLALLELARGAAPVFGPPGPMVPPPDGKEPE